MAGNTTVTAMEEVQRYYRKAKAVAQPVIDKMLPEDGTNEPNSNAEDEAAEELFDEGFAEGGTDWVDVKGTEETPTENNQENHRLATGTGPIEVASAKLLQKVSQWGTEAAAKVSLAPGIMRVCAENQVERLAEGVGRVTVSDTATVVLQRYPLLQRWRVAFFRGRNRGRQVVAVASPPEGTKSSESGELNLAEEPLFAIGDGEMETVPLEEEEGKGKEDWEQAV